MDVTIEISTNGTKTISVYDIEPGNNPEAIIAAVTAVHSAMFPDEHEPISVDTDEVIANQFAAMMERERQPGGRLERLTGKRRDGLASGD